MKQLLWAALAALMVSGMPAAAAAAMDPTQVRVLKAMAVPVLLPAVVPPGFKLSLVAYLPPGPGPGLAPTYLAIYDDGKRSFAIESVSDGIGDLPSDPKHYVDVPALKAKKVGIHHTPVGDARKPGWITDWMLHGKIAYRVIGAPYLQTLSSGVIGEQDVDAASIKKIVASLRPVKL